MAKGYSVALELSPVDPRPGEEREERLAGPVEVRLEGGDWVVASIRGEGQVASLSAYGVDPDPVGESERMTSPGGLGGALAGFVILFLMGMAVVALSPPPRPVR